MVSLDDERAFRTMLEPVVVYCEQVMVSYPGVLKVVSNACDMAVPSMLPLSILTSAKMLVDVPSGTNPPLPQSGVPEASSSWAWV
jgi:hypothetical protein